MFGWVFNPNTNGILLTQIDKSNPISSPVRPVFHEEMDALGFNRVFDYSHSLNPILWCANRVYYYEGEPIAKASGGSISREMNIEFLKRDISLSPVDMERMLAENSEKINFSAFDAIDFIIDTVRRYRDSIDLVTVSFSGGKDSTAVLDLVNRALGPDGFVAIFSDTGMELPPTYDIIEKVRNGNADLKFYVAGIDSTALDMWEKIGPPSRVNRWCCPILKTAPYHKLLREITGIISPRVLTFEGVRGEESEKRSKYGYIGISNTINKQMNARPILEWSQAEIFLYIFLRELPFNHCYRLGFSRVGCSLCPYGSSWSEYLLSKHFESTISPYVSLIRETAEDSGVQDFNEYMSDGGWKIRTGGYYLPSGTNILDLSEGDEDIRIDIQQPKENFWEWLSAIGSVVKNGDKGTFSFNNKLFRVEEVTFPEGRRYLISGASENVELKNLIRRVAYKTAYCIHCGACESECPTGALKESEKIEINKEKCTHCHLCINHAQKGCIVAKSLHPKDVENMDQNSFKGIDRYKTFGMRQEWLKIFLAKGDNWNIDSGMGNKQIDSMKNWLTDSGLWNKKITDLGRVAGRIGNSEDLFLWSIIWTNLSSNSKLIHWYADEVPPGKHEKNELVSILSASRGQCEANRTDTNAINSLVNLLDNSPIGNELKLGNTLSEDRKKFILKGRSDKVPDLALLYGLYRYSDATGRRSFVLGEIMREKSVKNKDAVAVFSPAYLFSISRQEMQKTILRLSETNKNLIEADFSGNLDNVHLNKDAGALEVVEAYARKRSNTSN